MIKDKIRKNIPVDRNKVNAGYLVRMALAIVSDLISDITSVFSGQGHVLKSDSPVAALEKALTNIASARSVSDATIKKAADTN